MTNATPTYWDVDGTSLQTYAFNIETVGGDRLAPPALRGDNVTVPYTPGDQFVQKQVASRNIELDMWITGVNEDGTIPSGDNATMFDTNFRKLRSLLWTPNRQIALTKRFYVGGVFKTATAQAQYTDGLSPSMTGRTRGEFGVTLLLADPYFYGPQVVVPLTGTPQTITINGDDNTRAVIVHIVGSRTNVTVTNTTLGVSVEYAGVLNSGDAVDINVKAYTALTTPSGLTQYNSSGKIRHAGDAAWLLLAPGANVITVASDSGIGGVTISYQEVWL